MTSACAAGGVDEITSPASTTTTTTTTAVATTTSSPAASTPTTAAPTTSSTTTPAPTTTGQPTELEATLLAALPTTDDLPEGWERLDAEPTLETDPRVGPGWGFCGGENSAARAEAAHVQASVILDGYLDDAGGFVGIAIHAFAATEDAQGYIDATREAIGQCTEIRYEAEERLESGAEPVDMWFDGFTGDYHPGRPWDVRETVAGVAAFADGADDAVAAQLDTSFVVVADRVKYRDVYRNLAHHERHGVMVVIVQRLSQCCLLGYVDTEPTPESDLLGPDDLRDAVDILRPIVLSRLVSPES